MFKYSLIIFIMLLITGFSVFAVDDQGNENDPNDNARANACYEDGSLANKCDTPWEWECGYYLIRFQYGLLSPEAFPSACASLLSAGGASVPTVIGCQLFTGIYDFFSSNFLPTGVVTYSDANCTTPVGNTLVPVVYTPNGGGDAAAICTANGYLAGGLIGGNVYHCTA